MFTMKESPVMDVLPWPEGRGFSGKKAWWNYVMSKEEKQRLDSLMGLALLDADICDRLLRHRDESLFDAFGLSMETRLWLRNLKASTLTELAQAMVSA